MQTGNDKVPIHARKRYIQVEQKGTTMSANELTVINPYTEEVVLTLPLLQTGEVDNIVKRERGAFLGWRGSSFAERTALCNAFIAAFEKMRDKVAAEIAMQMGKPSNKPERSRGLIEPLRT